MARHERLQRLLGGPELADLRQRLRKRYERGLDAGVMTLSNLCEAERAALAGILGRRQRFADSMRIDLAEMDAALRHAELAASLRDALEILDGPISNPRKERAALNLQWQTLRQQCDEPRLAEFLADNRGLGLLKRLSDGDPQRAKQLSSSAQRVLWQLPSAGVTRSRLAADVLGDAHALDQGQAVATLVLLALRLQSSSLDPRRDELADVDAAEDAQSRAAAEESQRTTWASVGVMVNELARPALFLNVPIAPGPGTEVFVPGEPGYLSLRALLRAPPPWQLAGRTVFVVENPNLLAIAADALGADCLPLVSTNGMPAAAQRTLLFQLAAAGAQLRYHGDFDWPGLTIGNWMMRGFGAQPWRFSTRDYRAALESRDICGRTLVGASVAATWDGQLAAEMLAAGLGIDEEAVVGQLLGDLV